MKILVTRHEALVEYFSNMGLTFDKVITHATAEELHWRKDEERCKQKLDLILNSDVDLMKFGYNIKLCKMFPELSKKTILFLLRKYNIPHFERIGSNITNLNL